MTNHRSPEALALARAVRKLEALCAEIEAYEERRAAYLFGVEVVAPSPRSALYRCFAIEHEAPAAHWPPLAGEALSGLRKGLEGARGAVAAPSLAELRRLVTIGQLRGSTAVAAIVERGLVSTRPGVGIAWDEPADRTVLGPGTTPIATLSASAGRALVESDVRLGFRYGVQVEGQPLEALRALAREAERAAAEG